MSAPGVAAPLGWGGIARIGLVQASIGAIVVLMTSTINRVMVIELHLAASVPGVLLGLHYVLQGLRPRWGHGADAGGRRAPWIVGGMAILAGGGTLAAVATALLRTRFGEGMALAVVAFAAIGIGVGMTGTAALTLLADRVATERRAAAAAMVWIMMFVGFVAASIAASRALTPFGFARLIELVAATGAVALAVTALAVRGLDGPVMARSRKTAVPFAAALRAVWADAPARRFAMFMFVAMLAYSAQDLILEPFAGMVFGLTPAQTAAITAVQHGGTLAGMIATALVGRWIAGAAAMRRVTVIGCLGSAAALALIALAGIEAVSPLFRPSIAVLGFANGVFAIAAVGLMMTLAGKGEDAGVRMGVWGAAQAIAFGGGGLAGAAAADVARLALGAAVPGYALVFVIEAGLFVVAATMMVRRERVAAPMLVAAE